MADSPGQDIIEVSIFGPGKGEPILVHLGRNEWIIVDSCINARTLSGRLGDGAVPGARGDGQEAISGSSERALAEYATAFEIV